MTNAKYRKIENVKVIPTTDTQHRQYTALAQINSYENVSAKYNDKKKKLIAVCNKQNIFEVFYSKDYHICTKIKLTDKYKIAKYHELWDMKYDIRVNTLEEMKEVIEYIFTEYNKIIEKVA